MNNSEKKQTNKQKEIRKYDLRKNLKNSKELTILNYWLIRQLVFAL